MNIGRYALAVFFVGIALGVALLLEHFHFRVPSALLLLSAVAISSWYLGLGAAVLAAILSTITLYWYFVQPVQTVYIYPSEIPFFITFVLLAVLLSWFGTVRRRFETGLREQASLLDLTHETVFVMDMEGIIKYWNRGAKEQYGWNAEHTVGTVVHDLLKTVFPTPLAEIKAELLRTGRWEGELLHTKKDGSQVAVGSRWALQRDEQGAPAAILETNNDISERKRAEEALRQSEAYLAESERLTHTGSWALDVASEKYVYISKEDRRIWAFDLEEGIPTGKAVSQRIHPEDRDEWKEKFENSLRNKVDSSGEYRIVLPDGTVKHIHTIRHTVLNSAGEVVQLVGTSADITERKKAEEALRESETRFRTFVDHAGDALFVYDIEQGTVVDVNREACESLGYTRQELIGKTPLAFHLDSYQAAMESIAERALADETVFDTHVHRRKDGTLFPVEVHTSLVSYGGRRFLLKVARDISDRTRVEEQRERLRQLEADLAHVNRISLLGELVASISHELKQPIAASITNANACLLWLKRQSPDLDEVREAAQSIVESGKRAAEIIDRLRSLYKKAPSKRGPVDLNEIVREMVILLRGEGSRYAISVGMELAEALPKIIADRVQVQQVMMNLMLNGIEAMMGTGGVLTVKSESGQDGRAIISVSDTGVGLPDGKADQIFTAFFTTKAQGSGMGLAISRSIVESHGGRIWATANEGRGATFHFTLPTAAEAAEAATTGK